MKRELTFRLISVHPDWNVKISKDVEKRVGMLFKLIGEVKVNKRLEMYFEDGCVFKTSPLDLGGYIYKLGYDGEVEFVTLCTKDVAFELEVVKKKIKVNIVEQLKLI